MFVKGQVYRRRSLHDSYGGNGQGGITGSSKSPIIFLFRGQPGEQHGYTDGWENGVFLYTGEGLLGDQVFNRGNRAIRDHVVSRKDLHLFLIVGGGQVQYEGTMVCIGYHIRQTLDREESLRQTIVFELVPLDDSEEQQGDSVTLSPATASISELRERASNAKCSSSASMSDRQVAVYSRSQSVKDYVAARSNGRCEGCGVAAPFHTAKGRPYIECHHIHRLSDGGPDHPRWVVGVCPNCHKRAHYSSDAKEYNKQLDAIVKDLEDELGP